MNEQFTREKKNFQSIMIVRVENANFSLFIYDCLLDDYRINPHVSYHNSVFIHGYENES